tara:strand:- start:1351 stop:1473 length:123 start_codon:yes stop_codon:yes gene_type:complete
MGKIDIRNLQAYEDEPTEQKIRQKKKKLPKEDEVEATPGK